jgi:hypothetical protein
MRGTRTTLLDAESVLTLEEEKNLLNNIISKGTNPEGQLHDQHTYYLNFSRHSLSKVFTTLFSHQFS